jgi:hypothetical protein
MPAHFSFGAISLARGDSIEDTPVATDCSIERFAVLQRRMPLILQDREHTAIQRLDQRILGQARDSEVKSIVCGRERFLIIAGRFIVAQQTFQDL